jgi:hypothetical protein
LEHVEKDSSAYKAGLKPLDFILEVSQTRFARNKRLDYVTMDPLVQQKTYFLVKQINGADVTSSTHDECVKIIKKSGETLALKILTVAYKGIDTQSTASSTLSSNNFSISKNSSSPSPTNAYTQNGIDSMTNKTKRK